MCALYVLYKLGLAQQPRGGRAPRRTRREDYTKGQKVTNQGQTTALSALCRA